MKASVAVLAVFVVLTKAREEEPATKNVRDEGANRYNEDRHTWNVWEHEIPVSILEEAKALFEDSGLAAQFEAIKDIPSKHLPLNTTNEHKFFAVRAGGIDHGKGGWNSDLTWMGVDSYHTYAAFEKLFYRAGLEKLLLTGESPIVDHDEKLRLFAPFFVVRSRATGKCNMHVDYDPDAGNNGLTFMAPIDSFTPDISNEEGQFQLLYEEAPPDQLPSADCGDDPEKPAAVVKRINYSYGKAVIFGSQFRHGSEPGATLDEPHVWLCFTFGSDRQANWPAVAKTIDGYQTKMLAESDGTFRLSKLGLRIKDEEAGIVDENAPPLAYDPELPKA